MKRIAQTFGFCLGVATVGQAGASTFDQCVLEHMRDVSSDKAATAIRESCLRTVAVPLPTGAINALLTGARASYGQAPAAYVSMGAASGLYITLNNQSGYILTELTIEVGDKNNLTVRDRYTVDRFPPVPQPHNAIIGPYPDPIDGETIRSGIREIFVQISKWDQSSTWNIVAANGFPTVSNQASSARSLDATNNPPEPSATCTGKADGECWVELSVSEKYLVFAGFGSGWFHSHDFARRQEFNYYGNDESRVWYMPDFDTSKVIAYFDQLYHAPENRTIWWSDAFDLYFRTQTNPESKDIPGLIALYQKHESPLFSGYLRGFVSPNKVVISATRDVNKSTPNQTITLLSVSANGDAKPFSEFMTALLNVKKM